MKHNLINSTQRNIPFFGKLICILFLVFFVHNQKGFGQLITEPFNYTVPITNNDLAVQSGAVWTVINSGDSINIAAGNLTYAGLVPSSGNSVSYGGAGKDYYRTFTSQTSGTVYCSFLLNVTSVGGLNTTGGYTIALLDGTTSTFAAGLWIRLVSGSNFNIGINPRTTAANTVWLGNTLTAGTTYLVVIANQIVSGLTNDVVKIWLNPVSLAGAEPAANGSATNALTDLTSFQRVLLRQDAIGTTPNLVIDEMRVGTTWASVTPVPSTTLADISQPSGPILQGTPNVVLAGFTVAAVPSSDFTNVTVTGGGSATSADINTVRIFRDNDGNGAINGADASVSGAGAAFAASMPLTISGETGITTARNYLIVANVDAAADISKNVSVAIAPGNYTATVTPNNGSATGNVREIDAATTPTINLSAAALTPFSTAVGTPSAQQSYQVDGINLTTDITITPPAEFKIRIDANAFSSSPITLTPTLGVVVAKTIDVIYDPASAGSHSGNITHISTGAVQKDKAVSGSSIAAQPTIQSTVTFGAVTNSSIVINFSGGNGSARIVVVKDTNAVTYLPTDGFAATGVNSSYFAATDKGTGNRIVYDGSGSTVTVTGLGASLAYYVAVYEYNGSAVTANYLTPSTGINNTTTLPKVIVPVPMASQGGLTFTENFADEANWGNGFNFGIGTEHWGALDVNVAGTIPDGKTTTRSTLTFVTTSTSGGVQRGSLSGTGINNVPGTIVLLSTSSGSRNACAIDFHVDFTGVSAGTLSFAWAAVANSTGDRPGFLKVYTSINGTTFTELTGAAVLNKANNIIASGSVSNVILPATLTNVADAIIRFYDYNGASALEDGTNGSRAKISIDNVTVTAGVPPTHLVVTNISPASPTQNAPFSVTVQAQDASNLPQNVLANTDVTLSYLSGTGAFSGTLSGTILAGTNNVVISGVIYNTIESGVSLTASRTSGDVLAAGNSATFTVIAPSPVITVIGTLSPFLTGVGTQSASQPYTVKGDFLIADIVITPPANFEVRTGVNAFSASPITISQSPPGTVATTTIDVRYAPSGAGPHSGNIANASTNATTQNIAVSGTTVAPEPTTASTVTFGCSAINSIIVNFTGGNGSSRIVVASPTAATFTPADLTDYTGVNSNYSLASPQIPADNRIVYDGSGSTVTITGLSASTTYFVAVYEYNGSGTIKNYLTSPFGSGNKPTLGLISYSVTGSTYSQNFDGLPSTGTYPLSGKGSFLVSACPINATNASGWQLGKDTSVAGGTGVNSVFTVNSGSSTSGSAYSYGSFGNSERALGSLASGGVISSLGVALVNNTSDALTTITISYTGEQWRNGGSGNVNTLTFSYSLNGTGIFNGTYTPVSALNFSSLVVGGIADSLDGNANSTLVSATFTLNGNWLPGQTLILKWGDSNDAGADDGLAIDDFSFSATVPVTPTAQDNNIFFPFISTNSLKAKWLNGNGANHLVKMNTIPPGGFTDPANFNGYSANPVWQNLGDQVIYNGTADSVDVTGLAPGTLYEFRVYGFNGSGVSSRYLLSTEVENPSSVFTEPASPPTKLVFLSVNGGNNPVVNQAFSVVIQSQDGSDNPQIVNINTTVNLTPLFGGSIASGTTSGIILAGTHTVTITGVKYDSPQLGVQLNAHRSAGFTPLADGQSLTFDVLDTADELLFNPLPLNGVVNTVVGSITVKTVRPDQTVDAGYSGSVTIAYNSGPGAVSGTLTRTVISGVATFNDIQFNAVGPFTLKASSSPVLTPATSSVINITGTPVMTELVVPKYMGSKSASASNNNRTPIAVCLQIDSLVPNTYYKLRAGLDLVGANPGFYGAGNYWTGAAYNTSNIDSAFKTDGSGSSKPFWVYFQPSGNSSRFGAGQFHNVRIGYAIQSGSTPSAPNFIGTKQITTLDIATSPLTVTTGDDGAFLTGIAANCAAGKYILVYDNVAGTGSPLFSYQSRPAIPLDTTNSSYTGLPAAIKDIYMQNGTSVIGEWPAVIPIGANNPSGVQRIEARNADNTIFSSETDADGVWPGGANTTNVIRRSVTALTPSDAPLSILISNLSPSTGCSGIATPVVITGKHFTGATSVKFNGLSATFSVISDVEIDATAPAGTTTGTVTVTSSTGCIASSSSFTVTPCNVIFTSNIFLEGYYIGGGLMTNTLFAQDGGAPHNLLDVDSITISAMDAGGLHNLVDAQKGILKTNGEVTVTFSLAVIANTPYYLKVNHWNSVETWSATAITLTPATFYSFSSAATQAFGNNEAQVQSSPDIWAIYSGDINQDGAIDGSDFAFYLDPDIQVGAGGYIVTDLNGDGAVDGSDFAFVLDPNIQLGIGALTPP